MANTKLSDLTALAATAIDVRADDVYINDDSAGTAGSKRTKPIDLMEASRAFRTGNIFYANDFYPAAVTSYADGSSHPLSEFFGSVGAAEAAFPHFNTARHGNLVLTDQVDWVAWQSCMDYVYDNDPDLGFSDYTFGHAKVIGCGRYQINRRIKVYAAAMWIDGGVRPSATYYGNSTSFQWRGSGGTDTAQVAIIDFHPVNEDDTTPSGVYKAYPGSGSPLKVTNIHFHGRENISGQTITKGNSPSTSGVEYVSGIRSRNSRFLDVQDCSFGGSLYDGVQIVSALWCRVAFCDFQGIYRDAISVQDNDGDFSTTVWIDDNEFGNVGRYGILMDYAGGNEPFPVVRRNSFEHISNQWYYHTHLEEFVHGVRASICQINGYFGGYYNNRCEATVTQAENMWGDLHLVNTYNITVRDNRFVNIILTAFPSTGDLRTTALQSYLATYGFADLTAERAYNLGKTGNVLAAHAGHVFDGNIQEFIIVPDGVGVSTVDFGTIANGTCYIIEPTISAGTYTDQVDPPGSASTTLYNDGAGLLGGATFQNFADLGSTYGPLKYGAFSALAASGHYTVASPTSTWAANTAYYAELMPAAALAVQVGYGSVQKKWVAPTTHNGCLYECTVSGTSHATTEPTWPTTLGDTVTDGTVTWKCVRALVRPYDASFRAETMISGNVHTKRNAPPTTGKHTQGTVVWARLPDYSGGVPAGWVCVATGTPGTWYPMGGDYGYLAVGSLPTASTALRGARAVVSDSNQTLASNHGDTVTAGGSAKLPVYCDGSAWKIG